MEKIYIRFTDGATTLLIDMNDQEAQNEAIDNGFYMIYDENNKPSIVESSELLKGKSPTRETILEAVQERLARKSYDNYMKINN